MLFFKAQHGAPDLGLWRHRHDRTPSRTWMSPSLGIRGDRVRACHRRKQVHLCGEMVKGRTQQAHAHADQGRFSGMGPGGPSEAWAELGLGIR